MFHPANADPLAGPTSLNQVAARANAQRHQIPKPTWQVGGAVWQFPLTQLRPWRHSEERVHGPHRGTSPAPPRTHSPPAMPSTIRRSVAESVMFDTAAQDHGSSAAYPSSHATAISLGFH